MLRYDLSQCVCRKVLTSVVQMLNERQFQTCYSTKQVDIYYGEVLFFSVSEISHWFSPHSIRLEKQSPVQLHLKAERQRFSIYANCIKFNPKG